MISKFEKEAAKRLKELERRSNEQESGIEIDQDPILRELANIVKFSVSDLFNEHQNLKPLVDQPENIRKVIVDVQVRIRRTGKYDDAGLPLIEILYSFKFYDKLKALHQLGKHIGAFTK